MKPELEGPMSDPSSESDSLRQIGRVNLTEQVHDELTRGLIAGRFLPGTRLGVRDLAAEMGLSPTPVREALQQLVAEGALTQEAGRSFRVPEFTPEDYLELRDLRLNLEGEAAAAAALRVGDAAIANLSAIHQQLLAAKAREDYKAALVHNQAFHLGVCAEAGNSRLLRLVSVLWLQTGPLLNILYPRAAPPGDGTGPHPHETLLEAFRHRDSAGARAALCQDIQDASADILDAIVSRRQAPKRKSR